LFATSASRLLVEVNRSLHHRNLFSEFSRGLSNVERQVILSSYYLPYRQAVEDEIRTAIDNRKTILHLSLHSFTPTLAGVARNAEIGLLYDSRREREALFCRELRRKLLTHVPGWRIRRNYPYLGRADGFTTHLRRLFRADHYLGIELEVNQRLMSPDRQKATIGRLVAALKPPLIS
jgi:predicted N-formylglutamate amidohydrolase